MSWKSIFNIIAQQQKEKKPPIQYHEPYTVSINRDFLTPLVEHWLTRGGLDARLPRTTEELSSTQPWTKADHKRIVKTYGKFHGTAISSLMNQLINQHRERLESGLPETDPYTVKASEQSLFHLYSVASIINDRPEQHRPKITETDNLKGWQEGARSVLQQLSTILPKGRGVSDYYWSEFMRANPYTNNTLRDRRDIDTAERWYRDEERPEKKPKKTPKTIENQERANSYYDEFSTGDAEDDLSRYVDRTRSSEV